VTFRVKKTANFCQISNAALRDTRLSYCARGILAMVMTHSDEWKTSTDWLRENTQSEGKVAIGNAIKELKAAGYLKITPLYTDGRFNGHVWSWSDAPQQDEEQNSRNQDCCDEESRKQDFIPEHQPAEHHKEEEKGAAEAAPLPSETSFPKSKAPVPHPKNSAPPPPTPKVKAPRPRNLLGEAMLEVCWGITDYTKATKEQWSLAVKAINGIKEVQPDLSPEMIRQFAAQKRREWDGASFSPGAFLKHWRPVSSAAAGIPEEDPFPGKITVTMADIITKFGNGALGMKWRSAMERAGRLR